MTEISAESDVSFEDAMNVGLKRAAETLQEIRSAWVKEQHVRIGGGRIVAYRVDMLVTFVLQE
ncbi:MAG: dodecin family protein [Mycobacterium leprae]